MGYVSINGENSVTAHSPNAIEDAGIVHEVDNEEIIDNYADLLARREITDFVLADGHLTYSPPQHKVIAAEVANLKAQLAETDYVACKIAEGAATAEEYSAVIAQRQAWRERINELEN